MSQMFDPLKVARDLAKAGELDKAWKICEEYLTELPSCPNGLILAVYIMDKAQKFVPAYQFAKRLVEVKPKASSSWTNLGKVCDELWLLEESEACHKKALELAVSDKDKSFSLNNLAALYINIGRFEKGEEISRQALEIEPDRILTRSNLGLCQLARHEWKEGFLNFSKAIGTPQRRLWQFKDEPLWDGKDVKHLIAYGEQGLGDELMFSSMIPDAIKAIPKVTLECDKRLENLFRRSFPCKVYGTRWKKEIEWDAEDQNPDASCPTGHLGAFFRQRDEDFPNTPYLKVDPERQLMWKALFKSFQKPVIGIAWTGGVKHTGEKFRRLNIRDFIPVFKMVDAHWVSLEYRDRTKEINAWNTQHPEFKVHVYPYATMTQDYDDTAALISALDAFVGIHTTALHCAGALGIPSFSLVSKISQWRYATGDRLLWYDCVRLFRQRADYWPMRELGKALDDQLRGTEARDRKVA